MNELEANAIGATLGQAVLSAVRDFQVNSPRSQQRTLGMSQMGGCREFIRATLAEDPRDDDVPIKWPAFVGTAVGDYIEKIMGEQGYAAQEDAVLSLDGLGIKVRGHLDFRGKNAVADLKTKDGLADVRREGPSFKEKAQISGYIIAKLQEGVLDEDGIGTLIYLDRSGKDPSVFTWTTTVPQARLILAAVEERLRDVVKALETGTTQSYLRDEPESWCWAVGCPFYRACWNGYTPTGEVKHQRELDAVRRLVQARDDEKAAKSRREQAREDLRGVEGVTPDGTIVRWTISSTESGGTSDRLDVREKK